MQDRHPVVVTHVATDHTQPYAYALGTSVLVPEPETWTSTVAATSQRDGQLRLLACVTFGALDGRLFSLVLEPMQMAAMANLMARQALATLHARRHQAQGEIDVTDAEVWETLQPAREFALAVLSDPPAPAAAPEPPV